MVAFNILVMLLVASIVGSEGLKGMMSKENDLARIRCGGNGTIEVAYAAYGKKDTCPLAFVTGQVQNKCNGRVVCAVRGSNTLYGDPCYGVVKYLRVHYRCIPDVNECLVKKGGCEQVCSNTRGSFKCTCGKGYKLNADGKTCNDVNECAVTNGGCQHGCANLRGSFKCVCKRGFLLAADGKSCKRHWVLQGRTCFKAKNNKFGSFRMRRGGRLAAVKLVHVSGGVACWKGAKLSNWGCNKNTIGVAITRSSKNVILFPNYIPGHTRSRMNSKGWYNLPGYKSWSNELILKTTRVNKVSKGEVLRLWYGEDLKKGGTESDNKGTSCADVYADIN